MEMKHLFAIGFCFITTVQFGQTEEEMITLEDCIQQAEHNYPLVLQSGVLDQITEEAIQKVNAYWQPQVTFNAQATYQSEVVGLPIESPLFEIPELSKDQYKTTIDVSQLIYDGGITHQQKTMAQLNGQVEKQKVAVELYKVKERVAQLYFSLLLANETYILLYDVNQDLQQRKKSLNEGFANGAVTQISIDLFEAEVLNNQQKQLEVVASIRTVERMLSQLTGLHITEDTKVITPVVLDAPDEKENKRPELTLFQLQSEYMMQQYEFSTALTMPKVSLFVQGGYGRPGLNYLLDEFDFYYLAGIKLNYPIWQGNIKKHDGALYVLNNESITHQQEVFQLNTSVQTAQQDSEIRKYNDLLDTDKQIIELRSKIKNAASVQLENGVITATEYLSQVNAELLAKQNMAIHEVQLLTVKANYLMTLGKL